MKKNSFLFGLLVLALLAAMTGTAFAANYAAQPIGYDAANLPANIDSLSVSFDNFYIDDTSIAVRIYVDEVFATEDVNSMQVGDTIEVYGDTYTIESIDGHSLELKDGPYIIFWPTDDDAIMYALTDNDYPITAYLGMAVLPLADEITVTIPDTDAEYNWSGENITVTVAAADLLEYFDNWSFELSFPHDDHDGYITLTDGKVTAIEEDWRP